ncbi:MAG TPA: MoaD/ThiS family protein [Acetobacteraceae bacterium]|jgi:molybdopterin converting factor small subunit|nr:MoaD/ThiS family protein [Acetobacteraceae bacterium]
MPKITLSGSSLLHFTNGQTELHVAADTFRRLIRELNARYPGLGTQVEEGMAIAIDGEIYQDAYGVALRPDSEIYIIPKIAGG